MREKVEDVHFRFRLAKHRCERIRLIAEVRCFLAARHLQRFHAVRARILARRQQHA